MQCFINECKCFGFSHVFCLFSLLLCCTLWCHCVFVVLFSAMDCITFVIFVLLCCVVCSDLLNAALRCCVVVCCVIIVLCYHFPVLCFLNLLCYN